MRPVFMLGMPRSGTTLIQRHLSNHPEVYSQSESWSVYLALETLRYTSLPSILKEHTGAKGLNELLAATQDGENLYIQGIGTMFRPIFQRICEEHDATIFLDKTPRYYHFGEELLQAFPDAILIIVLRNPLAVLLSIIETWCWSDITRLSAFKEDLLLAPQKLANLVSSSENKNSIITLHFEKFLSNSAAEIEYVWEALGVKSKNIDFVIQKTPSSVGLLGDKRLANSTTEPMPSRADLMERIAARPGMVKLLIQYAEMLDDEVMAVLGYNRQLLISKLTALVHKKTFASLPMPKLETLLQGKTSEFSRTLLNKFVKNFCRL